MRIPLWPDERSQSFTEALLTDPPRSSVLRELLRELEVNETPEDRALHPAMRRGRRMHRAREIMGHAAFAAATAVNADALKAARISRGSGR